MIQSISTLMKNNAMPTVRMISGSESSLTTGFTNALTTPKTAAATSSDVQPANDRVADRGDRGVERDGVAGPGPDGALHRAEASRTPGSP